MGVCSDCVVFTAVILLLNEGSFKTCEASTNVLKSAPFFLKLYESRTNFAHAKLTCESHNSWLVEVKTKNIYEDLRKLIGTRHVWIGSKYEDNRWRWMDGSPVVQEHEIIGTGPSAECLRFDGHTGSMSSITCRWSQAYVCQFVRSERIFFGEYEFFLPPQVFSSYTAAKTGCHAWDKSAHLIDLSNQAIENRITEELNSREVNSAFYTGGNDIIQEDRWVWSNGTEISHYINWNIHTAMWGSTDEPNGQDQENCLLLRKSSRKWKWFDLRCSTKAKAICQKRIDLEACSYDFCSNHGRCELGVESPGMIFSCQCDAHYHGRLCELDPCLPNPCQNYGYCMSHSVTPYYICDCHRPYQGKNCQYGVFKAFENCLYHINLLEQHSQALALKRCGLMQSSLAILKYQRQRDFIYNEIQKINPDTNEIWVGGSKIHDSWKWFDGSILSLANTFSSMNYQDTDIRCTSGQLDSSLMLTPNRCGKRIGYVCERPAQEPPCNSQPCRNRGSCENVGCHYKCRCPAGYDGNNCENDLISIDIIPNTATILKNEYANVTLIIKSRVGNVTLEIRSTMYEKNLIESPGRKTFLLGPFEGSSPRMKVSFTSQPQDQSFSRVAEMALIILDPPNVTISHDHVTLPVESENRYIHCSATGEPTPKIDWYKGNKKVQDFRVGINGLYQIWITSKHSSLLAVRPAKTTDAGIYTCRASNIVRGKKMTDDKQLSLTIPVRFSTINISTSTEGSIAISCIFESFSTPSFSWTFYHDGVSIDIKTGNGSIFTYMQESRGIHHKAALTVVLLEWLREGEIRCRAKNKFDEAQCVHKINGRVRNFNGLHYTFSNTKKTHEQSKKYCSDLNSEMCTVLGRVTHETLMHASASLQSSSSVHIGGTVQEIEESRIWVWNNGKQFYNETLHNSWKRGYGRNIDGSYVGWLSGKPSHHIDRRCLSLAKQHERYWSNVNCDLKLSTICQKEIHGLPTIKYAEADNCSTTIHLFWSPSPNAIAITHRVEITPTDSDHVVEPDSLEFTATKSEYEHFFRNLNHSTTYKIRIYPCPDYCTSEGGVTKNVTTDAGIPEPVDNVTVGHMTEMSCKVSWTGYHPSAGIFGYKITVFSSLQYAASEDLMAFEDMQEIDLQPGDAMEYIHGLYPNRNYSFFIQARTCAGLGPLKSAEGDCITDRSAPNFVPTPTQFSDGISEAGTIDMTFPQMDETNGPVSCVFILVDTRNDGNSLEYNDFASEKLRSASFSEDQSPPPLYIALALSAEEMTKMAADNAADTILRIGDKDSTTCDASHIYSAGTRRKRDSDPENVYFGYNAPLSKSNSYKIFAVSATPTTEGRIIYKSSEPQSVGQLAQAGSSAWVAGLVIGLLVVVLFAVALIIRRKPYMLAVMPENRPIELQENVNGNIAFPSLDQSHDPVYENVGADVIDLRSETDIPMMNMEATYKALISDDKEGFRKQYEKLKCASEGIIFPQERGSEPGVTKKNRYRNIRPYDRNIVSLSGETTTDSYINASYIEGFSQRNKFIATQGPLPATVNDFWRMVSEQECHTIVMLTKCMEHAKKKCAKYWPELGQARRYGDVNVTNESEEIRSGYILRSLIITSRRGVDVTTLQVQQFQFLKWPDHGVPIITSDFFSLQRAVYRRLEKLGTNVPTVVHCSAGAGRTGAFISYDYLSEERKVLNCVDVCACVYNLRRQRVQMVQSMDQYIFVYKLLLEDYLFGNTEHTANEFSSKPKSKIERNQLIKEFYNLNLVKPMQCRMWSPAQQSTKKSIVPYMHSRVVVHQLPGEQDTPYLNASYIPTYDASVTLIAAQGPVQSSLEIFWRAVFDNNVSIIVMLTNCVADNEEQCIQYWPNNVGDELRWKCMRVEITHVFSINKITIAREFHIFKGQESKKVLQYQMKGWLSTKCPDETSCVLDLITKLKSVITQVVHPTLLIHCSDGVGRTGTFCAILNLIDRVNCENVLDVFRVAKDLRDFRPGMIATPDQYEFCYKAISDYLAASRVYSNFGVESTESVYANV